MDIVVWAGPVAKFQVPGATVPGASEDFIPCLGDKTPNCPAIAEGWTGGQGRKLPGMLAHLGLTEGEVDNIYLGAFSAGGSAWKRLLMHPADREKVKAVMLADATYTSPVLEPIEGFVLYGLDALKGDKMFVATASASPNKTYGTGAQVLDATRQEIERRSGVRFQQGGVVSVGTQPDRLYTAGQSVVFADYGWQGGGHGFHPKIAPQYWQNVLQPWLLAGPSSPPEPGTPLPVLPPSDEPSGSPLVTLAMFGAGVVIGWAVVSLVDRSVS